MRKEKIFIKHCYARDSCWYSPHEYNIYNGTERIGLLLAILESNFHTGICTMVIKPLNICFPITMLNVLLVNH